MLPEHYNAARNHAAVIRQDWMGILTLTGSERQAWLQGMVTNEVEKLTAGQGCYAGHLNAQGKLIAQMIVLVSEDELQLLVERVASAKLAGVFDRLIIMEDVQVRDVSDETEVFALIGPRAGDVLKAWTGRNVSNAPLYSHYAVPRGRVVSTDLGYDVIVSREMSDLTLKELIAAGAMQIARETFDVVRAEAGIPLYGVDIDESTILPELGPRGISYDKGCYIGQEVVARIKYIGHVNRRFVGFVCEGTSPPDIRSTVRVNEKDVGYVTTALFSPTLGKPIALGFVNRAAAEPGTSVTLVNKDRLTPAIVASLPFFPIRSGD